MVKLHTLLLCLLGVVATHNTCFGNCTMQDSEAPDSAAAVLQPPRDSVLSDLRSALADPSREIYLLDRSYLKYGPITSFRDGRFRVWDTRIYVPLDSVAGLYEHRDQSGVGALIGLGVGVLGMSIGALVRSDEMVSSFASYTIVLPILGSFIGSLMQEEYSWPAHTFRTR